MNSASVSYPGWNKLVCNGRVFFLIFYSSTCTMRRKCTLPPMTQCAINRSNTFLSNEQKAQQPCDTVLYVGMPISTTSKGKVNVTALSEDISLFPFYSKTRFLYTQSVKRPIGGQQAAELSINRCQLRCDCFDQTTKRFILRPVSLLARGTLKRCQVCTAQLAGPSEPCTRHAHLSQCQR